MSTNKTENYSLHRWEPADNFLLSEINENFTKLDTAVASESTKQTQALAAARTALESQIAAKAKVVAGTYTGNGAASQTIELGFTPVAVISMTRDADTHASKIYGGIALPGAPVTSSPIATTVGIPVIETTSTGFVVYFNANSAAYANKEDYAFHFVAFA